MNGPNSPGFVVDSIMAPKDVCILIPGTCKYVPLLGEREFADLTILRILKWEIILGCLGEPSAIRFPNVGSN